MSRIIRHSYKGNGPMPRDIEGKIRESGLKVLVADPRMMLLEGSLPALKDVLDGSTDWILEEEQVFASPPARPSTRQAAPHRRHTIEWLTAACGLLLLGSVLISFRGWLRPPPQDVEPGRTSDDGRDADAGAYSLDPFGETTSTVSYLNQNWSTDQRQQFYFTPQGSQILPYDWFLVLEQADSQTLFRDDANMLKLGYLLEDKNAKWNPDGLPVGFVKDVGRRRNWLGFNCAACHTSQIDYKGVSYRIDGGAALADVQAFLSGVTDALKATRDKEDKFLRFSGKILGTKDNPTDRDTLKAELTEIINQREGYNARNFPANAPSTRSRRRLRRDPQRGLPPRRQASRRLQHHEHRARRRTGKLPVSLGHPPARLRPVERRGQQRRNRVPGTERRRGARRFWQVRDPRAPGHWRLFIDGAGAELARDRRLAQIALVSPVARSARCHQPGAADAGRKAFEKAKCNTCHKDIDRTDKFRRIEAKMQAVGTEDRMAVNFTKRFGDTGLLEGAFLKVVGSKLLGSPQFKAQAGGEDVLAHVVIGTILGSPYPAPEDELTLIDYKRKQTMAIGAGDRPDRWRRHVQGTPFERHLGNRALSP